MPFLLTLCLILTSFTLNAEIYTWKDENGVTHFAQDKPDNQTAHNLDVDTQKPTSSSHKKKPIEAQTNNVAKKIEADPKLLTQEQKLANEFLIGRWSGFSKTTKKQQLWIFKTDGFFTIKQTKGDTESVSYSGEWTLDYEDILLSINFKASDNNGQHTSGFVSIENSAEIIENSESRMLISFNEEEFWLERN